MSSVVDKYYRRIIQNIDNVRMKFDISSLLAKTKEHDSKINTNESDISSNLSKINNNLSLINTNKSDISNNLSVINNNESDISNNLSLINTNLSLINTNKSNISNNLSVINSNKADISNNYKFTQINKKKTEFNTSRGDTNRNNIASNLLLINSNQTTLTNVDSDLVNLRSRINTHQTDIQNINQNIHEISESYKLKDIMIFDIVNNINDVINKNKPKFIIFEKNIVYNFKKDSFIQLDSSILTFFSNHYVDIQFFYLLLECFNDQNVLFKKLKINIVGTILKHGIVSNSSVLKIPYDINDLKIKISINLQEKQNRSEIVKIMNFDNHILKFLKNNFN